MNQKIVLYDVETTGLNARVHNVLQFGAIVCENGKELDSLKINIVHENPTIDERAMEINKIDLATHEGYTPEEAVSIIKEFMAKHFVKPAQVCGHNVTFDVAFMKELFESVGEDYNKVFSYRLLDTSAVARFLVFAGIIPPRGKLGDLAKHFKVPHEPGQLHDALVDCRVTYLLLLEMTKMFPNVNLEEENATA